jgi:hypothetical protein
MSAIEVGPRFWNIRGQFKIFAGLINIGTHMSIIGLNNGKFLIVDTIPLDPHVKTSIDYITNNGSLIEAVLATHPFHTLAFPGFYAAYPNVPYYGTPRHIRNLPDIKWVGDLNDCATRSKWSPEVEMRIPDGAEFVAPVPEKTNHFSCVFVYHRQGRTIHVDDTIFYTDQPGFLLKVAGFRHGDMSFHPSIKAHGLYPTPEAPYQFKSFIAGIINDWEFDNIVAAHTGNKIGGARDQLKVVLDAAEPLFFKLSERNKKKQAPLDTEHAHNVHGNECG